MTVELICCTTAPDELCGLAAQLCTGDPIKALRGARSCGRPREE